MMINAFNWTVDTDSILRTNDGLVSKVSRLTPILAKSKDQSGPKKNCAHFFRHAWLGNFSGPLIFMKNKKKLGLFHEK